MPAFEFAVGLGVVGAGADVGDSGQTDELFEVAGDELRSVVGDDAGLLAGVFFEGHLQDEFDVSLGHRLAQFPMHDGPAVAIEEADEVVKRSLDVDVGDVDVPVCPASVENGIGLGWG